MLLNSHLCLKANKLWSTSTLEHPSQTFLTSFSNLMDPAQKSHRNASKQEIKILWSTNLSLPTAELVRFEPASFVVTLSQVAATS